MIQKSQKNCYTYFLYCFSILILFPTVISYKPSPPGWDESVYLFRSVSLAVYAWHGNFKALINNLSNVHASPLMNFFALPWGFLHNYFWLINLSVFGLTTFTFLCMIFCFKVLSDLKANPLLVLLASLSITFNTIITPCEFLSDTPLAWLVLATLLMTILEMCKEYADAKQSRLRAAQYGLILGLGCLVKISFCYFALCSFLVCFGFKVARLGWFKTLKFYLVAFLFFLPELTIFLLSIKEQLRHVTYVNSNQIAQYYALAGGKSFLGEISRIASCYGIGLYFVFGLLLACLVLSFLRRFFRFRSQPFVGLCILSGYIVISLSTLASDTRYLILILVSFSFLLPTFVVGKMDTSLRASDAIGSRNLKITTAYFVAFIFFVAVIPTLLAIDTSHIQKEIHFVQLLNKEKVTSLSFATDTRLYNPSTATLADFIVNYDNLHFKPIRFYSAGHCHMQGHSLEECSKIILQSDAVFFDKDADESSILNQYVLEFYKMLSTDRYKFSSVPDIPHADLFIKIQ